MFEFLTEPLTDLTLLAILHTVLLCVVIPFVLMKKRDPTVAVAWSLFVLLTPVIGSLIFWVFGYNYLHRRRVIRKRTLRSSFQVVYPPTRREATRGFDSHEATRHDLVRIARSVDAYSVSAENDITIYHETVEAYEAILEAIASATHHVHLEFFIFRNDETGRRVVELLTERARAGVKVRLLYDAVGSLFLPWRMFRKLVAAGGEVDSFLPVNPLRSWIQINLRNHRKIVVIDGKIAFTGGMNIGDEYLGKSPRFGYWRDTMMRIHGPAVAGLQRTFLEDWYFASKIGIHDDSYFPFIESGGSSVVQVVESGPDQEINSIREIYFAAILSAKQRLWIASPYFVPDNGLLDALRLARRRGVDVRLLCLLRPDHLLSFYASRYYWADMLTCGAKVYQYSRGMMHAKIVIVDEDWAMVGSANLDNRSLHLNFEINCLLYTTELVNDLARRFQRDIEESIPLDSWTFANRSLMVRLLENGCRLLGPIL